MAVWAQGSQYSGYDYVQATTPTTAEEGETWYDMESDRAAVYTGDQWKELTVTDHGQLANIEPWQHLSQADVQGAVHDRYTDSEAQAAVHDRYTDNEAIAATDGVIDAETVDGQHAGDLGRSDSDIRSTVDGQVDAETVDGIHGDRLLGPIPWEHIGTINAQSATSVTGSIPDAYDLVKMVITEPMSASGNSSELDMVVNNITTADYTYRDIAGYTSEVSAFWGIVEEGVVGLEITVMGNANSTSNPGIYIEASGPGMPYYSGYVGVDYGTGGQPTDSITFQPDTDGETCTFGAEVYGATF